MNDTIFGIAVASLLALGAAGAVYLLREQLSLRAKGILLALVAEAEEHFGPGTGEIKLSSVLSELYARMPLFLQLLFPQETVVAWVEGALAHFKEILCEVTGDDGI